MTLYFAYGSNMLKEQLIARCPDSIFSGRAILKGHRLTFDKPSQDGSGKCTFVPYEGSSVEGILWILASNELRDLDDLEGAGHGYERRRITLNVDTEEQIEAQTYCATTQRPGIRSYDWYLALVMAGARQHGLSGEYQSALFNVPFQVDNDKKRPSRLQALSALESANMLGVLNELKS